MEIILILYDILLQCDYYMRSCK